jgi:hypothetical protein
MVYKDVAWIYLGQESYPKHGMERSGPMKEMEICMLFCDYELFRNDSFSYS